MHPHEDVVVARYLVTAQFGLIGLLVLVPGGGAWAVPLGLRVACAVLVVDGVGIMGLGATSLGRGLTATPLPNQHAELRTGGLYRYVRHPIYTGLLLAATDRGLCFAQFGGSDRELLASLRAEFGAASLVPSLPSQHDLLARWTSALAAHLRGRTSDLRLPLDVCATAFQYRVWRYLCSIPSGELRSYAEVARAIGSPRATRAVARACASNTAAVAIPCHRVIRESGHLGGYRWGAARKAALLGWEAVRCAE